MRFYSPLVLNIAQERRDQHGRTWKHTGTGQDGRVSKKMLALMCPDTIKQATNKHQQPYNPRVAPGTAQQTAPAGQPSANNLPAVFTGNVEVIEMDRCVAENMVDSKHIATCYQLCRMWCKPNLVLWRKWKKILKSVKEEKKITHSPVCRPL